jgi:hypothetical protein
LWLDLIGVPQTTGNARRLARVMRELGFVPLKSRRLAPGGYKDTVTRGWARALRASGSTFSPSAREHVDGRPKVQQVRR